LKKYRDEEKEEINRLIYIEIDPPYEELDLWWNKEGLFQPNDNITGYLLLILTDKDWYYSYYEINNDDYDIDDDTPEVVFNLHVIASNSLKRKTRRGKRNE